MIITKIFLGNAHAFVGHFGGPPGQAPMSEVARGRVVAGRGIVGDRYFNRPDGHKGQVTFFAEETWLRLADELDRPEVPASVFRRNVITRDTDLRALIGAEFEIDGIRFVGTEHCKPCVWMDQAFAPGALKLLSAWTAGGLRARALSSGWLATADASGLHPPAHPGEVAYPSALAVC